MKILPNAPMMYLGNHCGLPKNKSFDYLLSDNPAFTGSMGDGFVKDYPHEIEYKINDWGHRTGHVGQEHFLVVGGSQSFGLGVPYSMCWPTILSQELSLSHYNLSLPASNHEINLMNLLWYISKVKPKFVIWEWLADTRKTIKSSDEFLPIVATTAEAIEKNYNLKSLVNFIASAEESGYNRTQRAMLEINLNNLSNMQDIPFYYFEFARLQTIKNKVLVSMSPSERIPLLPSNHIINMLGWNPIDVGRDGEHYGVESHRSFAKHLIEDLKLEEYTHKW